jgi:hypothetical protein
MRAVLSSIRVVSSLSRPHTVHVIAIAETKRRRRPGQRYVSTKPPLGIRATRGVRTEPQAQGLPSPPHSSLRVRPLLSTLSQWSPRRSSPSSRSPRPRSRSRAPRSASSRAARPARASRPTASRTTSSRTRSTRPTGLVPSTTRRRYVAPLDHGCAARLTVLQGTYKSVTATFTVPKASGSSGASASAWVGIDGDSCGNAILQTGLDFNVGGTYDGEPALALMRPHR